jgi:hypothetical protein
MGGWQKNDALERIWKESVAVNSGHFPRKTGENQEISQSCYPLSPPTFESNSHWADSGVFPLSCSLFWVNAFQFAPETFANVYQIIRRHVLEQSSVSASVGYCLCFPPDVISLFQVTNFDTENHTKDLARKSPLKLIYSRRYTQQNLSSQLAVSMCRRSQGSTFISYRVAGVSKFGYIWDIVAENNLLHSTIFCVDLLVTVLTGSHP